MGRWGGCRAAGVPTGAFGWWWVAGRGQRGIRGDRPLICAGEVVQGCRSARWRVSGGGWLGAGYGATGDGEGLPVCSRAHAGGGGSAVYWGEVDDLAFFFMGCSCAWCGDEVELGMCDVSAFERHVTLARNSCLSPKD